jgi:hypothetical protein
MSMADTAGRTDVDLAAYKLGYCELGRIFTCFSHLLLRHARQLGSKRLAFVSRDGDLLMRCTARMVERIGRAERPALSYVHISRQTSFLPALNVIDSSVLDAALEIRGERAALAAALTYLGMPLAPIASILARLSIDPDRSDISPETISVLVADEQFRLAVRQEGDRQRSLLAAYLEQEHIGNGVATLLVDIGWRGSILTNINSAFSKAAAFEPLAGAFLGLWSEGKPLSGFPAGTVGLIADIRRRRNVLEASAWFAAFLLEAVCRANEGTTVGYQVQGERVAPILAGDSESRRAEEQAAPLATEIRRGIMDYLEEHGATSEWLNAPEDTLRIRAQRSLLRLACFPRAGEIEVGARLVHTEGHTPNWSANLINSVEIGPLAHPRRWLAGLASPWRTGYIGRTGGPALASAFLLLESVLLALPPDARLLLARMARRAAGGNLRPPSKRRIP